jgi:hypothetical protein
LLGLLGKEDVFYAESWIDDLKSLGVVMPAMPNKINSWTKDIQLCLTFSTAPLPNRNVEELIAKYLPLFKNIVIMIDLETFIATRIERKSIPEGY